MKLRAVSALPDGSVIAAGNFGLVGGGGSATFGELSLEAVGDDEVLVVKLDATGEPVWANRAGPAPDTTGTAEAFGVSAGAADGSAIVVGYFTGEARFGSTDLSSASSAADVFVAKVDADGDWVWAVGAGGSEPDLAFDVSMLPDGSAIVAGTFSGSVTFGATTLTATSGTNDAFVAKVDANGTWAWAVKAGGTGFDQAIGVSVLPEGSAIVVGEFNGTATFGGSTVGPSENGDVFVAKVDADGTWAWAVGSGGPGFASAQSVSVLPDGSAIVAGQFFGTATFGAATLTSAGGGDAFVAKLSPSGAWTWATAGGGADDDAALGVVALPDGSAVVVGYFQASAASFGGTTLTIAGDEDAFVAQVDPNGAWVSAVSAGADFRARGNAVALLPGGSVVVSGFVGRTVTFGPTTFTTVADVAGFVASLALSGSGDTMERPDGGRGASGPALTIDCDAAAPPVGARVTCTVSGGDPGVEILWRAAYNPVFAGAGVTLDAGGSGTFSFVVPASAVGEELTVELVEWLSPASLGTVGGPVPTSVPAGDVPVPVLPQLLVLLAVASAVLGLSRSKRSESAS